MTENNIPAGTKAVIYFRVSSREQAEEGFSLEAQLKLLRQYAADKGIEIVREFEDIESAKASGRKQWGEMLAFLRTHKSVKTIIAEKTDRVYRNFGDYVELDIDQGDYTLVLVKEGVVLCKDSKSHEKLVHGFKLIMAKNYIDNLKEETTKGMLEKAEQGHFPQQAPVGYRNNKETRLIEPDGNKAPLIRRLFELYATGCYSLELVREKIWEEGLRSRTGRKLAHSEIAHILNNPIYYGTFRWRGKAYIGKHEPIISKALFDTVQKVMKRFNKPRKTVKDYPFRGLLTCGLCGCAYTAELVKGRYVYYHCTRAKGKCQNEYYRQEELDKRFEEFVQRIHIDDETLNIVVDALKASHGDEKAYHDSALKELNNQYARLQQRLDKAYEEKLDGVLGVEVWSSKSREWRTEQEKIRDSIANHERANQSYFEEGIGLLNLANKAPELYRVRSLHEKRALLNVLASNFTVNGKKITPTYKKPFDILAEGLSPTNPLPG